MQYTFEAIGTPWQIDIPSLPEGVSSDALLSQIKELIAEFDKNYSRFRADSLVTKMSQKAGVYELPKDGQTLFDAYRKFYDATDGAVTPLIGQTMEQAGYDASYSLLPSKLTMPPSWNDVLNYKFPKLELKQPALLDFGAAGKGYLVDLIGKLLESAGTKTFCIDGSGDILCQGEDVMRIGLENPANTAQAIGVAQIKNQSLCASAGNRRKWEGFNHIIDPRTLKSPEDILATWVVADSAILADGLATCLFFSSPQRLISQFKFEYLILYKGNGVEKSSGFPAELFYK